MITKRKAIRFKPDQMTTALLDFSSGKTFEPQHIALVINESYTGCAIVMTLDEEIKKGKKIKIQIGKLDPMKASIAWVKNLEENILKLGIEITE